MKTFVGLLLLVNYNVYCFILLIKPCLFFFFFQKSTQLLHIGAYIQRQVTWINFCRIPQCSLGIQ